MQELNTPVNPLHFIDLFLVSGRGLACQQEQENSLVLAKTPPIHYYIDRDG